MSRRSKRQDLPSDINPSVGAGLLQVVATPIGNLQDVSSRMREALVQADVILAEDTRRSLHLLQALEIPGKRLERLDSHQEYRSSDYWLEKLESGLRVALVSDAGTPGISDPGSLLVQEALARGIRVEPIPGPSALSTFVSVAGFAGESAFGFLGFFPRTDRDRQELWQKLEKAKGACRVWFFFESPERIASSLGWLLESTGSQVSQVRAVKELTKIHEKIFAGSLADVFQQISEELKNEGTRGEWCFAVRLQEVGQDGTGSVEENPSSEFASPLWQDALKIFSATGLKDSELSRCISKLWGVDRKAVYDELLRLKGKDSTGAS